MYEIRFSNNDQLSSTFWDIAEFNKSNFGKRLGFRDDFRVSLTLN